jgi:hypothetical protein
VNETIIKILEESKGVKTALIADEILDWLIANVENYVSNDTKIFKIDLIINTEEGLKETRKLQDLYHVIPDDVGLSAQEINEAVNCRTELNKITEEAYSEMCEREDKLKHLFSRLIFFYEKILPSSENKKRAFQIDNELRELINRKENASEVEKEAIQKEIADKLREGEQLVKFEQFEGTVSVLKFEYEAFDVGVKIVNKESGKTSKEYNIGEGFTVWIQLTNKVKQRPTTLF